MLGCRPASKTPLNSNNLSKASVAPEALGCVSVRGGDRGRAHRLGGHSGRQARAAVDACASHTVKRIRGQRCSVGSA